MSAIFLYVGNIVTLDPVTDVPLRDHLINDLGHTVTIKDDADTVITGADALVVSESVSSTATAWMQDDAIGIICCEGAQWDELDMGSGGASATPLEDTWNILDNTHFITNQESTGALIVRTVTTTGTGSMSGAATGKNLANWNTAGTHSLVAYETGDTLVAGAPSATAPDRRVFMGFSFFADVNAAGISLFDRGLTWVLHLDSAVFEQEGFRFRNDDGSESAATWRQTQDVNDSVAKQTNIRLRVLSDATADPPTQTATLQFKRDTDAASEWRDV